MQLTIATRRFRLRDMERILEIEAASFGPDAYDRKLFAEFFHTCGGLFLVAVRGTRVLGYVITHVSGQRPGLAELVSIAVDPAARGRGVASALLESSLRRLRRRRVTRYTLAVRECNRPARAFYAKYGFQKLRKLPGYYEDGEDGLLLRRTDGVTLQ